MRDVALFEDDSYKLNKFNLINEYDTSMANQIAYRNYLDTIDLGKALIRHSNKCMGRLEHLDYLNLALNELGFTSIDEEQDEESLKQLGNRIHREKVHLQLSVAQKNEIEVLLKKIYKGEITKPIATADSGMPYVLG